MRAATGCVLRLTYGHLTGELRSLDQNATLPLADIQIAGDTLRFAVTGITAGFSGAYGANRTVVEGTFTQSGAQFPLILERSEGTTAAAPTDTEGQLLEAWIGELDMGTVSPVMQFRIVRLASGDTVGYFDSVTEGRTGFPATWSMEEDSLTFTVAAISLTYRGALNDAHDSAEGIWSQGGREVPLTLSRQANVYETANVWENRPQRPTGPFPYDAEEVVFQNTIDHVTLAGTLTVPKTSGRHPVVVLISGSGAQDRDETLMGHKPFLVLADYLSRRGIAVLRYDDRGTAGSTGDFSDATTEDFARDASAAVEFLAHHEKINPSEIGLAGHSEGGLVAPMVVGLREDVAFVVLLGATGVNGATIIPNQTEAMMRAADTDDTEIEIATTINRAVIAAALETSPGTDYSAELEPVIADVIQTLPESVREEAAKNLRLGIRNSMPRMQGKWMRFFLAYDPRPALRNIKRPVLAIWGSKDVQVLPDLNRPEVEKALIEGGNTDYTMVELEGLNHMFQQADTGSISEYASIQETFNPKALDTIGDWIIARVTPVL